MAIDTGSSLIIEVLPVDGWSPNGRAIPGPTSSRIWPATKRVIDVAFAAVLLLIMLPVLVMIALAVKLDSPGPFVFRQERCGRGRQRFTVLKFRTMYPGVSPEAHRRFIAELARSDSDVGPGLKKLTADPRVTRVGAFLRRTSLDELPQLINVIKGEMSIVGPRPALDYELEHYEAEHYTRFEVRPGLTGLWQVSGRNTIDFRGMLALDAQYARTTGLRVDTIILARTPWALLRGHAA